MISINEINKKYLKNNLSSLEEIERRHITRAFLCNMDSKELNDLFDAIDVECLRIIQCKIIDSMTQKIKRMEGKYG